MFAETSAALSVSALNALAKNLLEQELTGLWVSGEVSNLTRAASGHMYFALKDRHAQVRCALFRGNRSEIAARLKDGDEIELSGRITLYEARGEFQIVVNEIRHTGAGKLYAAYEALKQKLAAEGLFDEVRKQRLPEYPQSIGIVTSPAAAALRDVVTTFRRRNPNIRLILYPAAVQGKGCEQQIAAAIQAANIRKEVDLLIVCRGGGSIEDLWGFNEETAVRAIAASALPVINAVGHETDFTLSDFAADKRAPTPTAAAEIAAPALTDLAEKLRQAATVHREIFRRRCLDAVQKLDYAAQKLQHPREKMAAMHKNLQNQQILLNERIAQKLTLARQKIIAQERLWQTLRPDIFMYAEKIGRYTQFYAQYRHSIIQERCLKIAQSEALLNAVSPQNILERGYSVVSDTRGKVVKSNEKLKLGQKIHIRFANGTADAFIAQENKQMDLFD